MAITENTSAIVSPYRVRGPLHSFAEVPMDQHPYQQMYCTDTLTRNIEPQNNNQMKKVAMMMRHERNTTGLVGTTKY